MNPRLKKLQDEKAAEVVEKKVRKKRAKKVEVIIPSEKHDHLVQLNSKCTPKDLQHHYISMMHPDHAYQIAARRKADKSIVYMTEDLGRRATGDDQVRKNEKS